MPFPNEHSFSVNGGALAVFEWPGAGPPLVFVHATGFHARCWDQVIAHLPGRHCYAVDMRGHGRSHKPAPPYHWRSFAEDLLELGEQLKLTGALGIGHSMGAHSIALAEALQPGRFAQLLLIDPTILPQQMYTGQPIPGEHFVTRRRNEWSSAAEMFEHFKDRSPFASWDAAVLRDYCEFGLLPATDGVGLVLACPPIIEGSIYHYSTEADIYRELATIEIPVQIIRARSKPVGLRDLSASPATPDLVSHFKQAQDTYMPERSHFIPMEVPAQIAQIVKQLLAAQPVSV